MMFVLVLALGVGLVVGIALLAVDFSNMWIPALGARLAPRKTGAHTEADRELATREADLAERERIVERSLADAEKRIAEAMARIEAREAVLNDRETELRQQEIELEDRQRSVGERERELTATKAVPEPDEGPGVVYSDWWEKQLGGARSAKQ